MASYKTAWATVERQSPRVYLSIALLAACAALTVLYVARPPDVDPITIWPFWFWSVPALVLSIFTISPRNRYWGPITVVMWSLMSLLVAEEPASLARALTASPPPLHAPRAPGTVRVVTLNCEGGTLASAAECFAWDPDIVLLQEAPAAVELRSIVRRHAGWGIQCGFDPAIMARGTLEPVEGSMVERGLVCAATVRLEGPDGPATPIRVLSTRLLLPHLSAFILSPQVWRDARDTRADRARQMREVAQCAREALPHMPVICGGDFNTPAGDSLLEILKPELRDAYPEGGAGWPNTVINSAPMSRVDQVWVSEHFEVVGAWVRRTAYSDHRAVIVDVTR